MSPTSYQLLYSAISDFQVLYYYTRFYEKVKCFCEIF